MYYTRESYTNFLDTEINAQIRDFEQVVRTKALVLKSRGNVFVGKFQKLQDNGTAVFKVRYSVSIRFTTYFLEVFENIWDKIWRN